MAPTFIDDAGRPLSLAAAPRRIVSLVPSLTELVDALGAGDRLVGVTRYCTHPPEVVARLPKVGGTKNPSLPEILDLHPDLVLVNSEENPLAEFEQLVASGVDVFVSFPKSVRAASDSIAALGAVLECPQAANVMVQEIAAARAAIAAGPAVRLRVFCPIWRNPWMSFNGDTYAHDVLHLAGGDNVCARAAARYPEVDLTAIAAAQPEVVLLPDEPYRFEARHRAELAGLAETPAVRQGRVHLVDGKALSWYGPRTAAALRYFEHVLTHAS